MTPGFIHGVGVVTGIAVGFVPQMVTSWQAIREAQQVRGHKVRGVRDVLPLVMPLLVTALERARQLAESMEARGFGGQVVPAEQPPTHAEPVGAALRLGRAGAGFAGIGLAEKRLLAGASLVVGLALLVWSFWDQGRRFTAAGIIAGCGPDWIGLSPWPAGVAHDLGGRLAAPRRGHLLLSVPALHAVADLSAATGDGARAAGPAGAAVAASRNT